MQRINMALVGVRGFGGTHVKVAKRCEELGLARLVAVADPGGPDQEEIRELRAAGVRAYRSLDELLDSIHGEVEVIGLPVGINLHAPFTVKCLSAGYHVMCEKPVAGTIAEVNTMQLAEKNANRMVGVGYQYIYSPSIQRIKQLRLNRELGELVSVKGRVLWPRGCAYYTRNSWAGRLKVDQSHIYDSPFQNAASHFLQNMLYIAGDERHGSATPTNLYGENYGVKDIESADTQFIRFDTIEGVRIAFTATHATLDQVDPITEYIFEQGRAEWIYDNNGRTRIYRGRGSDEELIEEIGNGQEDLLNLPWIDLLWAIQEERRPLCTLDNSRQHVLCVETMFQRCGVGRVDPRYTATADSYVSFGSAIDSPITYLPGIGAEIDRMYAENLSFYESGAEWADPGTCVELNTKSAL